MDKYGGEEHLDAPPKELLLAQSESYVEYNRKGKIIKGIEKSVVRSKYEEDDYPNNHTSVWGSYWKGGEWGFKCCYSFVKNSYCTGEEGKKALEHSLEFVDAKIFQKKTETEKVSKNSASSSGSSTSSSDSSSSESEEDKKKTNIDRRTKRTEQNRKRKQKQKAAATKKRQKINDKGDDAKRSVSDSESSSTSSDDDDDDRSKDEEMEKKNKLRKALIEQAKNEREGEKLSRLDDRERPYHSNYEVKQLNDVELEAYKLRKIHADDPMASYFNKSTKK